MQYGNASRYGSLTSEQIGVSYHYVSVEDFETLREQVEQKWRFLCFLYMKFEYEIWKIFVYEIATLKICEISMHVGVLL